MLGTFASLVILAGWFVREILNPVDFKWRIYRPRTRMPPGPRGIPLFGNLYQFFEARDNGKFASYVSRKNSRFFAHGVKRVSFN